MKEEERFTIIGIPTGLQGNAFPGAEISEPDHEGLVQIWRDDVDEALDIAQLFKIALEVYYEWGE